MGFTMNIAIKPFEPISSVAGLVQPLAKSESGHKGGFQEAMVDALKETSNLQMESGRLSKEFTLESPTVSLEETMLAGVKSNISFQATLQTRNRLVQSYTDIMNMQI